MAKASEVADERGGKDKEKKPKFDPSTLPEELRPVYEAMHADYTQKTQALAADRAKMEEALASAQARIEELNRQVAGYEQALRGYVQAGDQAGGRLGTMYQGGSTGTGWVPEYDPFNPESVRAIVREEVGQYHNYIQGEYQKLVQGLTELQAYNYQLMRLVAKDPDVDIGKILDVAPKYGNDLEQAYRAIHESPKVWEKAKEADQIREELERAQARIRELEAKGTPQTVLGGTIGPIPRSVAQGQTPRTYEEVASTISPAEILATEGERPMAGTAGAAAGAGQGKGASQ